jgi:hypothetical protein
VRRTSHRLIAGISFSSSVTNIVRLHYLSSTSKQNRAAVQGWTFNEYRHSSKHFNVGGKLKRHFAIEKTFKILDSFREYVSRTGL